MTTTLRNRASAVAIMALVALAPGCNGCDNPPADDAGNPAVTPDAGGGSADAGHADAGRGDAGRQDGGSGDAGSGSDGGACTAGTAECTCAAGGSCNAGLVCSAGLCVTATAGGLNVSSPEARACEVLLRETSATAPAVDFSNGVKGKLIREAPSVAIAFSAGSDAPIAGGSVALRINGSASGITVRSSRCFNRTGAVIPNATVTLE